MNFHEPDLEDLIQSDLHTEMNKILHQSESESAESLEVPKSNLPVHSLTSENSSTLQESTVARTSDRDNQVSVAAHNMITAEASESLEKKVATSENLGLAPETYVPKSYEYQIKTEINQPEISEDFSLEKFPVIEEELKKEAHHVEGTEMCDLSNLAWLTGLDVQQTLQQSEIAGSASHIPECSLDANPTCLTDVNTADSSNVSYDCIPLKPQNGPSNQTVKKPMMRFTPIQPNIPYEDCQRYQLHHGEQMQRKLLFSADHMNGGRFGMHRGFHPYPPPPYGSSGAMYIPETYHHGRMHHQGKKVFPKPVYSYSCLIAMSLRASKTGCLPVSDIYNFMMENFPYFKTAPDGWKNSVRHNLSLNKCFEKVEKPNGSQRKGCLWALNPAKISKMEEEVQKWKRKDPDAIRRSMSNPEELDRELEDIRRSDEEAARRRMLSMSSHGLSMLTPPPPGYNPYIRPGHPHQHHPNLHPSGTTSLPTTPQHYHHHRTPQRPPMIPNQSIASGQPGFPLPTDSQSRVTHPPRQLFSYPSDPHTFSYGHTGVSSTPNPAVVSGSSHLPSLQLASSLSSSSGGSSLLGTLTDTFVKSANDLNDIDLDSSLADLSAFQGTLWDDTDPALLSHPLVTEADAFDEGVSPQGPHLHSHTTNTMSAMEPGQISEEAVSESSDYDPTSRFRGDMSYLNGSNNKAAVH